MKQTEIVKLSKEDLQDKLLEYQKQLEELKIFMPIKQIGEKC